MNERTRPVPEEQPGGGDGLIAALAARHCLVAFGQHGLTRSRQLLDA